MHLFLFTLKPEYVIMIGASAVIILSFVFNYISQKTNIPSVLLLMALGIGLQYAFPALKTNELLSKSLVVIGKVGLLLIVLEAALDLKLKRDKLVLIGKAFLMALAGLLGSAFATAYLLQYFFETDFYRAFVYAVPLSILSSAIIIPSVARLQAEKKEFMIYESTFSDILGIILFQFLVSPNSYGSAGHVFLSVTTNILTTAAVAIVFGYVAIWGIQRLTSHVRLFLIIAVLMLVYAVGSIFHLSALIIVLFFGLILNNAALFFRGPLRRLYRPARIKEMFDEFYIITLESAFVLRTFFFVIFGLSISLVSLADYHLALRSLAIIAVLYAVRFLFLKALFLRQSILPELFIAPRGLITILLFFTIPDEFRLAHFDDGILLYTILLSSLIMTLALVTGKGKAIADIIHEYDDLNKHIERSLEDGHLDVINNEE